MPLNSYSFSYTHQKHYLLLDLLFKRTISIRCDIVTGILRDSCEEWKEAVVSAHLTFTQVDKFPFCLLSVVGTNLVQQSSITVTSSFYCERVMRVGESTTSKKLGVYNFLLLVCCFYIDLQFYVVFWMLSQDQKTIMFGIVWAFRQ